MISRAQGLTVISWETCREVEKEEEAGQHLICGLHGADAVAHTLHTA